MVRRIAITLATVAAAGFMAAAPAAAYGGGGNGEEAGKIGASYFEVDASRENTEFLNVGGPYGITYGKQNKAELEAEGGSFYAEYLSRG
ncbi:hypothetical protein ACPXCP_16890 [Streptomyces sp. DT20]|uniref:hypothetical protein n=1 Tax=unclassified Streptomyces TaxID=2593676 RepID=UPI0009395351|nr:MULTISPECIES: hypothetical protein [unclassified Streptomyces]OKK10451.1 hypothetical protein AMK09_32720 [Streptomyces sp. CB02488]WRZ14475.1 hypothetical protein OG892_28710 [Streptomyces sp. NBC_00341]